jgi:hypothetical protein
MNNPLNYHEKIKNEQHVFLYAVSGRSSSTALQRIINSGNQVWLWGEPHGILRQIFLLVSRAKDLTQTDGIKKALKSMYFSYVENKHLSFYPNAVGNLDSTIELSNSLISNFLKPWAPKVKRFGFKEIDSIPIMLLEHLKEIYPQCIFIFCFRDPVKQWPSLCKLKLEVSADLDLFLRQYESMATNYMKFARKHGIKAFVESTDLRDIKKVDQIIKYLNITKIDTSLIDVTVHTIKPKRLSKSEIDKIINSPAYKSYLKMQKVSRSFYSQQPLNDKVDGNKSNSTKAIYV